MASKATLKNFVDEFLEQSDSDGDGSDPLDVFTGEGMAAGGARNMILPGFRPPKDTHVSEIKAPHINKEPSLTVLQAADLFVPFMKKSMAVQFLQKVETDLVNQPEHVQRGMVRHAYDQGITTVMGYRACGKTGLRDQAMVSLATVLEDLNSRLLGSLDEELARMTRDSKETGGGLQNMVYYGTNTLVAVLWLLLIVQATYNVTETEAVEGRVQEFALAMDSLVEVPIAGTPESVFGASSRGNIKWNWDIRGLQRGTLDGYRDPLSGRYVAVAPERATDAIPTFAGLPVGRVQMQSGWIATDIVGGQWSVTATELQPTAWGDFVEQEVPRLLRVMYVDADLLGRIIFDDYERLAEENPSMPPVRMFRRLLAASAAEHAEFISASLNYGASAMILSAAMISTYVVRRARARPALNPQTVRQSELGSTFSESAPESNQKAVRRAAAILNDENGVLMAVKKMGEKPQAE